VTTVIASDQTAALWAVMAIGTALSIWLEQTYRWAQRLSGPVVALLLAMALANTRLVPAEAPAYDVVGDWLVPLAIPLLLFRANLREIFRSSGSMLLAFHLAAVGTMMGTALAVGLLRGMIGETQTAQAAGMMAASYIGGGVNFLAIKASYDVPVTVANPLIVADNFVMAGVFMILLGLAGSAWMRARYPHPHSQSAGEGDPGPVEAVGRHGQRTGVALLDVALCLAFAFTVVGLAAALGSWGKTTFGDWAQRGLGWQMAVTLATNKFVLLTTVTLVLATLLSEPLGRVNGANELGTYCLSLFLFTLGLPADLVGIFGQAPLYFVFCGIIALTNLGVTLGVGRLLGWNLEELLVAVNASLGGAPTAAAMAVSAGWPRLVVPGLLAGIWGYVVGTPVGVVAIEWLLRRP
jgi:uncharacterized membrane protein